MGLWCRLLGSARGAGGQVRSSQILAEAVRPGTRTKVSGHLAALGLEPHPRTGPCQVALLHRRQVAASQLYQIVSSKCSLLNRHSLQAA